MSPMQNEYREESSMNTKREEREREREREKKLAEVHLSTY